MMPKFHRIKQARIRMLGIVWMLGVLNLNAATIIQGDYSSMTVSGSNIVALDPADDIYTSSDDGVSFTLRETTVEAFEEVEAFGATVIAVGIDGLILRSSNNGLDWSAATAPTILGTLNASAGRDASPSDNAWLAVGFDGFDAPVFKSTDDGATWSLATTLSQANLQDVAWTGTHWLAAGSDDLGFDGRIYHSTDGINWQAATLPASVSPLTALAKNGSGLVIAVGENGELLRSTDDGLTFTALDSGVTEDLNAVVMDSNGVSYLGGVDQVFIEVTGTVVDIVVPPTPDGREIEDIILINDEPALSGNFEGVATRTIPFAIILTAEGTEDYRLTIEETLVGRAYHVETTEDLGSGVWADVEGKSASGTGASIFFDVSINGQKRFWRVVEF